MEPRFPVRPDKASLWVLNALTLRAQEARLHDVSCSGLGLAVDEEVPVGSWVRVEFGEVAVFGEARYCRRGAAGEYRVGVQTDWLIAQADLARWGGTRRDESEAQLCKLFREMKAGTVRYGPPV